MEVNFAPAFLRITKKLDPHIKDNVKAAVSDVISFYESGEKTKGLGIKHLRGTLWEARSGLQMRVVFDLSGKQLTFILAGSHNDVKNFLKR